VLDVEKGGYEVGRHFDQMFNETRDGPSDIIISANRLKLRQSTEKYNVSNEYIAKIVHYIEEHYTDEISIDELTQLVPLSRRNLEIKFKDEMGTSIYQFILLCRIEYFANLLLITDLPLFDLALQSGFNDCKNISRIFKKIKGNTPIEFRNKFRDVDITNVF
jgi:LacI family transcriptional regulator